MCACGQPQIEDDHCFCPCDAVDDENMTAAICFENQILEGQSTVSINTPVMVCGGGGGGAAAATVAGVDAGAIPCVCLGDDAGAVLLVVGPPIVVVVMVVVAVTVEFAVTMVIHCSLPLIWNC